MDENIIRIETVHDAFVASLQRIFFLFDFEKTSQQLLKAPKVPRSTCRHVWGIRGDMRWPHSTGRPLQRSLPLIHAMICPSMYKRNLRQEKYVENIFEPGPNGTAQNGIGRKKCDPLSCCIRKQLLAGVIDSSVSPRLLVRSSSPHSTRLAATHKYLAVPRVLVSS
jgi:hypothetical protein